MADQLLPPPKLSPEESVKAWIELLDLGEELVQAGIRQKFGPELAISKYREWAKGQEAEQDQHIEQLVKRLARADRRHG